MNQSKTSSDKYAAAQTAALLAAHGVRRAVLSPGSRNAPLITALTRCDDIACVTVVDERSAGFVALGMAVQSGEPVALVCTSGTALLNYAPAVAEAYYRRVPLIVISADRPLQWIDQDDSQTIRQPGALDNIVKLTHDIPSDIELTGDGRWLANRLVNDALLTAVSAPAGPVHINIRLDAPLGGEAPAPRHVRVVESVGARRDMQVSQTRELAARLARHRRVLVVAGFAAPSHRMNRAMDRLACLPMVSVLAENIANLHGATVHTDIDRIIGSMSDEERRRLTPDVVITTGGALVSRFVKTWLRESPETMEHWHVGQTRTTVDCFRRLTLRVDMDADIFMSQLASALLPYGGIAAPDSYSAEIEAVARRAAQRAATFADAAPWCDLRAFATMIPMIGPRVNLHLSNGTSIRYSQLFDCRNIHRVECNRGVSGIDGSTSTAVGAAMAYNGGPTLLVTGDMSAMYDLGALAGKPLPASLRIVIIDNGGGSIFRFIGATRAIPEVEERFACAAVTPQRWDLLAGAFGLRYYEAADEAALTAAFRALLDADGPALLRVVTPPEVSARQLTDYFDYLRQN